jgi:hypothetical protein
MIYKLWSSRSVMSPPTDKCFHCELMYNAPNSRFACPADCLPGRAIGRDMLTCRMDVAFLTSLPLFWMSSKVNTQVSVAGCSSPLLTWMLWWMCCPSLVELSTHTPTRGELLRIRSATPMSFDSCVKVSLEMLLGEKEIAYTSHTKKKKTLS